MGGQGGHADETAEEQPVQREHTTLDFRDWDHATALCGVLSTLRRRARERAGLRRVTQVVGSGSVEHGVDISLFFFFSLLISRRKLERNT